MDEIYMRRALELAEKGIGSVNPNPYVGAVIVKNGNIIGEGWHEYYGGNHGEVNAFNNATEDVDGATLYVNLEPCSHYGKTPPCVKAIVEKGIKKVVIALTDPNPKVAGKGIEILRNNGIEVVTGILENESKKLNEVFIKYITTKTPFCIMKGAMTLDGKIASYTGDSRWVSNEKSRNYTHRLRNKYMAIMAGIGTVLKDNPSLNTRIESFTREESRDPIRVIIDTRARIPLDSNAININSKSPIILATTELAPKEKIIELREKSVQIISTPLKNQRIDLQYLMKKLGERKIDSILLEGGGTLNYSALTEGIVDKINIFIAPKLIGGANSMTPVGGEGIPKMNNAIQVKNIELQAFGKDILVEGYV